MSWAAPKDTSLPNIVIHGVDAAADAGDSTKGYHSTLNILGIYPLYEPNFEPVECINNNLIYSKYFVERYEIEFAPFKVRLNSNWQDYKDLDFFLRYVMKKDYLFMIILSTSNLNRAGYNVDNTFWYDKPSTRILIKENNISNNKEQGTVEVSLTVQYPGIV